jgi:hypothetical protein
VDSARRTHLRFLVSLVCSGGGSMDDASHVRLELEIGRLRDELMSGFDEVSPDVVESELRDQFHQRADYPVQEFVPIFVERSVRHKLRVGT